MKINELTRLLRATLQDYDRRKGEVREDPPRIARLRRILAEYLKAGEEQDATPAEIWPLVQLFYYRDPSEQAGSLTGSVLDQLKPAFFKQIRIEPAVDVLARNQLLSAENVTAILKQAQYAAGISSAIKTLARGHILNQANVDRLLATPNEALLIARNLGGRFERHDPVTRDFLAIRQATLGIILAAQASRRAPKQTGAGKSLGDLPYELLLEIAKRTGSGKLDQASVDTTARQTVADDDARTFTCTK